MTTALGAAGTGLATWVATMATAPRYSYGPGQDLGGSAYYLVLFVAALAGGFVAPARASLVGLMLVLPGLALAPRTAPRGDDDGLWVLIFPLLCVFALVAIAVARVGAWASLQASAR